MIFSVPAEIAIDMGPQFKSSKFAQFLQRYGVHHRQSSCYFPHWNCCAEVAVKPGKRMIRDNIAQDGQLTDKFVRALRMYRNMPILYISEKCMQAGRYAREVSMSLSTCCNLFATQQEPLKVFLAQLLT